ncbi:hypothetical protein BJX99DRAFT_264302 [Aspergillus californicus]
MASFTTLPLDIYHLILDKCYLRTIHHLTLTSKAIHPIATEYLYRNIHWGPGSHKSGWSCWNIQKLLHTLIHHPQLSSLVRKLSLDIPYERTFLYSHGGWEADDGDIREYLEIVKPMGVGELETWHVRLKQNSYNTWIALLLTQLGSIEILDLGLPLLHRATHLAQVVAYLIQIQPSQHFARLHKVCLGRDEGFQILSLNVPCDLVIPFLHLPLLEELDLTMAAPRVKEWKGTTKSTLLRALWLFHMRGLTAKDVRGFVALAPRLRELHLGWNEEIVGGHVGVDFVEVRSALICISGSLEILTFNNHWSAPLGSMKQFHALKHLALPIELLIGVTPWERDALSDVLPPNLQSLRLIDDSMTWGQKEIGADGCTHDKHYLQDFIHVLSGYLPTREDHLHLRVVELDFSFAISLSAVALDGNGEEGSILTWVQELRILAERGGVGLLMYFFHNWPNRQASTRTLVVSDANDRGREICKVMDTICSERMAWDADNPQRYLFDLMLDV